MDLSLYNLHYVMGLFGKLVEAKYYSNIEKNIDTSGLLVLKYPSFIACCVGVKDSHGMYGGMIQGTIIQKGQNGDFTFQRQKYQNVQKPETAFLYAKEQMIPYLLSLPRKTVQ